MKILLAVDGSPYTKKAIAFLLANEELTGADGELVVLNVQIAMPPRVKAMVGAEAVSQYQQDEAGRVLRPIERDLKRHGVRFQCKWVVGHPGTEIARAADREKAHMVVMGTHGHGMLGRALMGSVAQNVVTACTIPVLLVK
jgi:nucleotide-binding universal stress UspA family protein